MRRLIALGVLAALGGGCLQASREAAPFEGRWKSVGFGTYLVIDGGGVDLYEHTSVSCGRVLEGAATGISEVARIDEGRLVIDEGGLIVRYDPIEVLPDACGLPFGSEDPSRTFEVLVATFSEHYAFLDARDPRWEARSLEIGSRLTPASTDGDLREAVADLLRPLGDAQIRLITDDDVLAGERVWASVDTPAAVAALRSEIRSGSLIGETEIIAEGDVVAGRLTDGSGYLGITSFAGIDADAEKAEEILARTLDRLLLDLGTGAGLVIDLRANPGGFRDQALLVASRFVPVGRTLMRYEARIGGTQEYVDAGSVSVTPMPTGVFGGVVVVLTGPGTIGAAELLVLALRDLPNITVVGETTAGSISPLLARTLPNGWAVGLANTRVVDAAGKTWDVVGIPPDEEVPLILADIEAGRDPPLERARELLEG